MRKFINDVVMYAIMLLVALFVIGVFVWAPWYALGVLGFLIVFGLVSKPVGFFGVDEARATAFQYLRRYKYLAMEFRGHHFDLNGFICDDTVSNPNELRPNHMGNCWCIWRIGGWIFYSPWFVKLTNYTDRNKEDGFGEGKSVFLNQIQRDVVLKEAKTKKGENITLQVSAICKMMVVNPYLFLFVAPKDVIDRAIEAVQGVIRSWVASHSADEVQEARLNREDLWNEVQKSDSIKNLRSEWGVEILKDSTSVIEVDYDPEYKAALKAKSQAGLLADAEAVRVGAIDQAMAEWVKTQAKRMGKKVVDAMPTLKTDGSYDQQYRTYKDLILANGGNLDVNRIEVGAPDGSPIAGDLGPAIALFAAATLGRKANQAKRGKGNNPSSGGKTDEQFAEEYKGKYGKYPDGYNPDTKSFR